LEPLQQTVRHWLSATGWARQMDARETSPLFGQQRLLPPELMVPPESPPLGGRTGAVAE
jgi:hypothetical protein